MGPTTPTSPQPLLPPVDSVAPHDPSVNTGLAGNTAEPLVPAPGMEPPPEPIPEEPNKSGNGEGSPSGSGEATTMTAAEYQAMMDAIRAAGANADGKTENPLDQFAKDPAAQKSYEDEMANIRRELDMSFDPKTGDVPDTKALDQFVLNPVALANEEMEKMWKEARDESRGEKAQAHDKYFSEVERQTSLLAYRAKLLAEKAGQTKNPALKAQLLKMADGLKADTLRFRNLAQNRQQQMQGSNSRDYAKQYLALLPSSDKMTPKQKANYLQKLLAEQGYKALDGRLVALKTKPTPAKNTAQARTAGDTSKKSPARTAEKTAAPVADARKSAGEKLADGREKPKPEKSHVSVPNEREVEVAARSVASQVDPSKREANVKKHSERHALIAGAKTLLAVSAEDEVAALDKGDKGASKAAGRMKKSALGVYRHAYQRGWDNLLDGNQSPEGVVLTGEERNIQDRDSDNGSNGPSLAKAAGSSTRDPSEIFSVTPDDSEKFSELRDRQRKIFGTETAFVGDFEGGYLGHFRNWRPRGERDLRAADLQRGRDFSSDRA